MSKMDNLRAMREARYEADRARARAAGTQPAPRAPVAPEAPDSPGPPPGPRKPAARRPAKAAQDAAPAADGALCGHRNMGGRTCTRELGHAAKSHRYS